MARPRNDERTSYTREALTDVAVQVFNTRGYDATRMEHIANAAGITKSSLYHHVSGKEELLDLAIRRGITSMYGTLELPPGWVGSTAERLTLVLRALVEVELNLGPEVRLLGSLRMDTALQRWARTERRRYHDIVTELVRGAQDEGALPTTIEAGLLSLLVLGTINSTITWYHPDGTWNSGAIAAAILTMVTQTAPAPL
jgi:AcrR family transcriptional regulator